MRQNSPLIAGTVAAYIVLFLVIALALAVSFFLVFSVAASGFSALAERQDPGSMQGPLTGLGVLFSAGCATVLFHLAVLAFLAYLRVPMMKFFLFLLSLASISLVSAWYIGVGVLHVSKGWYPVLGAPVREYPVLVLTPDATSGRYDAHVVLWAELAEFRRQNPEYSFLIPDGEQSELRSQLPRHDLVWAISHKENAEQPFSAQFEVTRLPSGRQKIIVSGSWYRDANASIKSWYEAEARNVHPKYFIEGDTWSHYGRDVVILVGSVDLALVGLYLGCQWKKIRGLRPLQSLVRLGD